MLVILGLKITIPDLANVKYLSATNKGRRELQLT